MADHVLNDRYDRIEVKAGAAGVIVVDGGSPGMIHYFMDREQGSFVTHAVPDLDRILIVARLRYIADALERGGQTRGK